MKKNWKVGVAAIAASALMLAGCASGGGSEAPEEGGDNGSAASGEPITVGVVAALTGIAAPYGVQALNSFNLAVEDLNELGGVNGRPIVVEAVDNMSRPEDVPALMRRLASNGASVILGASSTPLSITAAQTADQIKVPLVVPMEAAAAIIGEGREYAFKIAPAPSDWAAQGVRAVMAGSEEAGDPIQTAAIVYASAGAFPEAFESWEATLADEFPEVEIVSVNEFDEATTSDFGPIVAGLQSENPDVVIFGGNPQSTFLFYPALEESGWQPKATLGMLGGNTNAQFVPTVGAAAEGDTAGNYWTAELQPGANANQTPQGYVEDYKAKYDGQVPDGVGAYYYSAAAVVADALASVEDTDDHEAVTEAFRNVEISGINGDTHGLYIVSHGVKFDAKGFNAAAVGLVTQIVDGSFVPIFPEDVAAAPMVFPKR